MRPEPDPDVALRFRAGERLWAGDGVELVAARDLRAERDVALRRLTGPLDDAAVARFVRQAQLEGELEHPAVVPVLDVGLDGDGRPFAVLRAVRGTPLTTLLARRALPVRRRLGAFVDVCRAVAHAHARALAHGDLGADRVLIGDFGEVYLVDWAHAREDGDLAADVRALADLLDAVLAGEVTPPELADARAAAGEARLDAAGLARAVRRWLDGERDDGRRRELAGRHRDRAAAALAARDTETAMREAGRALALDPRDAAAAQVLGRLVLTAPAPDSPEAAAAVAASDAAELRGQARLAAWSHLAIPAFLPLLLWPGLKSLGIPIAIASLGAIEVVFARAASRGVLGRAWVWLALAANLVMLGLFSRVWGPLLAVPMMATTLSMSAQTVPGLRPSWLVAPLLALPVLGTWGLEALGVLSATTWDDGDRLVIASRVVALPVGPTLAVLALHAVSVIVIAAHYTWRLTRENRTSRIRLHCQAWHLEQIAKGL